MNEIVKEMLSFHVNSCRRRKENALFAYIIDGANKNATFFILVLYSKIGSICVNYRRTGKENAIFAYIMMEQTGMHFFLFLVQYSKVGSRKKNKIVQKWNVQNNKDVREKQ